MINVYICDDCMAEVPAMEVSATRDRPEPCSCGAGQDNWVFIKKPEPGCGGESK